MVTLEPGQVWSFCPASPTLIEPVFLALLTRFDPSANQWLGLVLSSRLRPALVGHERRIDLPLAFVEAHGWTRVL